ncbi:peptidoglycan/LPS O-acetylase OafA/YrhL [Methylosinus sp. sav-2]|uniref:acyltransferase family protein n=1 Tax=unclassified Methylosinus TaxID=2624500 RepID=UPI0004B88B03|nr:MULTISPECIES: acyltransferase [unclassified Methylosinus]TDX64242.1 peptidoglycan/LPS O-acetylase OafA/YrhL [Methylosinus sp. sav-2]
MVYPLGMIGVGIGLAYLAAFAAGGLLDRLGFPLPSSAGRISRIDGLRGLLALSVMMHHFVIWMQATRLGGTWERPTILFLENLGGGSVSIFFMITGFLFHRNTLEGFHISRIAALWVGRFFRLTPLVAASVVATGLIILWTQEYSIRPETVFTPLLTWVAALGQPPLLGHADSGRIDAYVLWSLKYEWAFYLFGVPLMAIAYDLLRGKAPTAALPLALVIGSLAATRFVALDWLAFPPLFAMGMLASEAAKLDEARIWSSSRGGMLTATICLLAALACAPKPYGTPWDFLLGLFFASVACGNDIFGLLRRRALLALGECSYGIYLFHGNVLFVLFYFGAPSLAALDTASLPLLLPLVAIIVVAVTATIFVTIEKPGSAYGRAFVARFSSAPPAPSEDKVVG